MKKPGIPIRNIITLILCFVLVFAFAFWYFPNQITQTSNQPPDISELESVDVTQTFSASPLSFLSWNGVWKGTDIDTDLEFSPDGTVKITHCGSGMDSTTGTYTIDGDTLIIKARWSNLVEMPGANDFPPLIVKKDDNALYLFPAQKTSALKYDADSAWPLRQIKNSPNTDD